jgi:hypothetical protein
MDVQNDDPQGPVPPEDAKGRLRLTATNTHYAQVALGTFALSCIALYGMFYWNWYFTVGAAQFAQGSVLEVLAIWLRFLGFCGIAALPFLPFMFMALIFPPSLVADDEGIVARNFASVRRMRWEDMRAITLKPAVVDRTGATKTRTSVIGASFKLSWMPVYGVAPQALAEYLNARQLKEGTAAPLGVRDEAPEATAPADEPDVTKAP